MLIAEELCYHPNCSVLQAALRRPTKNKSKGSYRIKIDTPMALQTNSVEHPDQALHPTVLQKMEAPDLQHLLLSSHGTVEGE